MPKASSKAARMVVIRKGRARRDMPRGRAVGVECVVTGWLPSVGGAWWESLASSSFATMTRGIAGRTGKAQIAAICGEGGGSVGEVCGCHVQLVDAGAVSVLLDEVRHGDGAQGQLPGRSWGCGRRHSGCHIGRRCRESGRAALAGCSSSGSGSRFPPTMIGASLSSQRCGRSRRAERSGRRCERRQDRPEQSSRPARRPQRGWIDSWNAPCLSSPPELTDA